jgi:hypothetical protein
VREVLATVRPSPAVVNPVLERKVPVAKKRAAVLGHHGSEYFDPGLRSGPFGRLGFSRGV